MTNWLEFGNKLLRLDSIDEFEIINNEFEMKIVCTYHIGQKYIELYEKFNKNEEHCFLGRIMEIRAILEI